jgi:transcriptional regulator with XRE-family HTH domain
VTGRHGPGGLRAARTARGWSQSEAARELVALARAHGAAVAGAASLKTLLSRWENGHAVPEPQYRALLGELYARTPVELGIAGPPADEEATGARARLRAALAAAAAVDATGLGLWREQLDMAVRLDDELGAAGAGELVRALVERLDDTHRHVLGDPARAAVAAVLAPAAALAGAQELDRGHHDRAWRCYDRARTAAAGAGQADGVAAAVAGQAAVLVDVGEPAAAVTLLDAVEPGVDGAAHARLAGARAAALAATGDAAGTHRALGTALQARFDPGTAPPRRDPPAPAQAGRVDAVAPGFTVELADVERWHGHALAVLGDAAAVAPLRRALAAPPRSVRHRAALHADLALALAAQHPEDAVRHARQARTLAERIGSARTQALLSRGGATAPAMIDPRSSSAP